MVGFESHIEHIPHVVLWIYLIIYYLTKSCYKRTEERAALNQIGDGLHVIQIVLVWLCTHTTMGEKLSKQLEIDRKVSMLTNGDKELAAMHDLKDLKLCRHRPESLDSLVKRVKFSRRELQLMYRGFKQSCPSGLVSREDFQDMFCWLFPQGTPNEYADLVFNTFDLDKNGSITFEEFVEGLSVISRGTLDEKLHWVFSLYDTEQKDYITYEELRKIVQAMYNIVGHCTIPSLSDDVITAHAIKIFQKYDSDGDGFVVRDEFVDACKRVFNTVEEVVNFTVLI